MNGMKTHSPISFMVAPVTASTAPVFESGPKSTVDPLSAIIVYASWVTTTISIRTLGMHLFNTKPPNTITLNINLANRQIDCFQFLKKKSG